MLTFKQFILEANKFDDIKNVITKYFKSSDIDISSGDYYVQLYIPRSLLADKEAFKKLLQKYGYFIASTRTDKEDLKYLILDIEKEEGDISAIPTTLYHASAYVNKDKILEQGLIPKESARPVFSYPNRIYLYKEYNIRKIKKMMEYIYNYDKNNDLRYLAVFEIDTTNLKDTNFHIDYSDDDSKSIWTNKPIPPEAIKFKTRVKLP